MITVAAHLRATYLFVGSSLHRNISLCTVTFGEKVLTLAKSRGYGRYYESFGGQQIFQNHCENDYQIGRLNMTTT